jgi:hypothetical protein
MVSKQVAYQSASLSLSLLLNFFLSVDLGTSKIFDFFQSSFLNPYNIYDIRHFYIVPHFTLS